MAVRRGVHAVGLAAAIALGATSKGAAAADPIHPPGPPAPIFWNPDWPRVRPIEAVGTGMLGGLTLYLFYTAPSSPWWRSTNPFDEAIHRAIVPRSATARHAAGHVSDFLVAGLLSHVLFVEPSIAAGPRHSIDVGEQLFMIDGEALMFALATHTIMADVIGRERPFARLCIGDEAKSHDCTSPGRYRSFYSGHTTMAFAAASLNCTNHINLPLYGAPWDGVACATGMVMAATVGTMRMVANRHYATDVLLGASIGMTAGFVVPWLFHYRGGLLDASAGPGLVIPRPAAAFPIGPFWSGAF